MELVGTRLGAPDARGRCRPEIIAGSEQTIEADAVIVAFGFVPQPPAWLNDAGIRQHADGRLQVGVRGDYRTHHPKVFAGGDLVRGADLVVTAVFEGRQAAHSIAATLAAGLQAPIGVPG